MFHLTGLVLNKLKKVIILGALLTWLPACSGINETQPPELDQSQPQSPPTGQIIEWPDMMADWKIWSRMYPVT